MRAPFRVLTQAVIVVAVASAPLSAGHAHSPALARAAKAAPGAGPADAGQLRAMPLPPAGLYVGARGEKEECAPLGPSRFRLLDWWRQWFLAHWQQRHEPVERPQATPFYLRSPLLTGFLGRNDSTPCAGAARLQEAEEECAVLNLTPGAEKPVRLEVPLPQLEARSARRLGALINEKLDQGESVVLELGGGQKVPVGPPLTHHVDARACRPDVEDQ
jgi:hypothetical protein